MGAAGADADLLAGQVGRLRDGRVLLDEEVRRRRVVGLRHVQALHPVRRDRAGAPGDVVAVAPAAGDHRVERRRDETRLDAEGGSDGLAGLGVVARHLGRGHLVRTAFGVCGAGGALDLHRLRGVVGIRPQDERSAGLDLCQLVGRGVAGRSRRRRGAGRRGGRAAATRGEDDGGGCKGDAHPSAEALGAHGGPRSRLRLRARGGIPRRVRGPVHARRWSRGSAHPKMGRGVAVRG